MLLASAACHTARRVGIKARRLRLPEALLTAALLLVPHLNAGAKKPKPAIKEGDARRVIAATPGFGLNRGAVRVKEISLAGATPVVVRAEVEVAVRFEQVESAEGVGARWRAAEFRTGDRSWDEFDYLVGPAGAERVGAARAALDEMAAEFESKQRERKQSAGEEKEGGGNSKQEAAGGGKESKEAKKLKEEKKREDAKKLAGEKKLEVVRGPLVMREFAPMYKSARAVVGIEASFRLERGADGKWRVVGFTIGDEAFGNFDQLIASLNQGKAARARADLESVRAALELFRRERGFYVVAEDEAVLIDHLSPRYLKTVIRVDPWHRPYRYEGTRDRYALSSDGPDGLPSTPDDVTVGG